MNLVLCALMLFVVSVCAETDHTHPAGSVLRSEAKAIEVMATLPSSTVCEK